MEAPGSWRRTAHRLRWLAAVVVLLGVAGGFLWYQFENGWNPQKVERMLATDLPPGSSREQVMSWLGSHGLKTHVYHNLNREAIDREGDKTIVELSGLDERDLGGLIRGIIYDANVDLFSTGDIMIYFFFDKSGRLLKHMVQPEVLMW